MRWRRLSWTQTIKALPVSNIDYTDLYNLQQDVVQQKPHEAVNKEEC